MFQKLSATSACACVGVWGSQVLTCERQLLAAHSRSPCSSSAPHICRALDGRRRPRLSSAEVRRTVGSSPSTQSTSPPRHRGYSPSADRTTLSGQPRAIDSLQCSLAPLHPQPLPVILSTKRLTWTLVLTSPDHPSGSSSLGSTPSVGIVEKLSYE